MTAKRTEAEKIEYGDSFQTEWGNVGDPRWPERITMRRFRQNARGERLIVDERVYELRAPDGQR